MMRNLKDMNFQAFDLFRNQWAVVSAGDLSDFNGCTVSWGSLGTLWTRPGGEGSVVTVYIHPGRYTLDFLKKNDVFTVSFFPKECRRALGYMGAHSGRDEDKARNAGLTPIEVDGSVTYEEANLTFVCKKLYGHQFAREDIAADVQEYYQANPKTYPVNEQGEWEPHWMFVGEIQNVIEK